MNATTTTHTVWVCVDCYVTHHGIADENDTPDREPLALLEGYHITAGGPHDPECPNVGPDGEWVGEEDCECERMTFSWASCEGCGSTLGGAREALTVWPVLEPCAREGQGHCSGDRVTVYNGHPAPVVMCGKHAL